MHGCARGLGRAPPDWKTARIMRNLLEKQSHSRFDSNCLSNRLSLFYRAASPNSGRRAIIGALEAKKRRQHVRRGA